MIIIGEKINGSIPSVAEAIAKEMRSLSRTVQENRQKQEQHLSTAVHLFRRKEEVETLKWMIDCIQEVTDLPISVDSPSADVLIQAYKFCKRPGLFNSVSGEGDKIDKIFPVMAQEENKGWEVIALLSDDTGIPKNAADRLRVFDKIMAKAKEYGIAPSRIHIDPLVESFVHLRTELRQISKLSLLFVSSIRPFTLQRDQQYFFHLPVRKRSTLDLWYWL